MLDNSTHGKKYRDGQDVVKELTRTEQLEQALRDIQADKCRIQKLQEDLIAQVEHQKSENVVLKKEIVSKEQEVKRGKDTICKLETEMLEKEDENIVVHMCVQKLQEELEAATRQLSLQERIIDEKDAYITTIKSRLEVHRRHMNSYPTCRDDLIKSLATDNVSSV